MPHCYTATMCRTLHIGAQPHPAASLTLETTTHCNTTTAMFGVLSAQIACQTHITNAPSSLQMHSCSPLPFPIALKTLRPVETSAHQQQTYLQRPHKVCSNGTNQRLLPSQQHLLGNSSQAQPRFLEPQFTAAAQLHAFHGSSLAACRTSDASGCCTGGGWLCSWKRPSNNQRAQ
jgi:hypothetical protein